jgi:MGT family glycosyltransferase
MHAFFNTTNAATLAKIKPGTKILFSNVPADGHFNPLTGLAVHLQSLGCDVRWYASSQYSKKIEKLRIPFYPFKRALDWNGDNIDEIFPERAKIKNSIKKANFDIVNAFLMRSVEYYADISEIYRTFQFDIFIADNCYPAIPFIKEKIGVPVIAIGVLPLTETSKDLPPAGLGMMPSHSFFGRMKQDFLRFLADKVLFRKPNQLMRKLLHQHGISSGKSNAFDLISRKSTLLLQSGTPGFEYKRSDLGSNVRFIGPLLPYTGKRQTAPWSDPRLKIYKKVILVTQGTVEKDVEKIIVPVCEAFKDSEYLVVATTGGSRTKELRNRFPQFNIIIEDFIPFADIMPHADVYVTNGGYGGVMLAVENQLPLVVGGIHEGKNEINARIGYFELGVNMGTEKPSPTQVKTAVEKVFTNPTYRNNVMQLSREFSQYDPYQLCASYVASLMQPAAMPGRIAFINRTTLARVASGN